MQTIKLLMLDLAEKDFIYGSAEGRKVLEKMRSFELSDGTILEIDFTGMVAVDACFIRESLASFLKVNFGTIGMFVSNVPNVDIQENSALGFKAKGMPILIKNLDGTGTIVADLTSAAQELIRLTYSKKQMTTHHLSQALHVSAPNASTKLKKLYKQGLLLVSKQIAETGGIEFIYRPFFTTINMRFLK